MIMSKKLLLVLISSVAIVLFFLPQSSYAGVDIPIADGFDFPLGAPNGDGYSLGDGLSFLERWDYSRDGVAEYHPGEDWNDDNSGNDFGGDKNDAGDPVYAVADGMVVFAGYGRESWGYVVMIEHKLNDGSSYWSQYGHLANIGEKVIVGDLIKRGSIIGYVGDYFHGTGRNYHLHFEIRKKYRPATAFVMNWSKEKVLEYYVNPSDFINNHRPQKGQKLKLLSSGRGSAELSWSMSDSEKFDHYSLHRFCKQNTALDDLVFESTNPQETTFKDFGLFSGVDYKYLLYTYYQDGSFGISNEIVVRVEREAINITNSPKSYQSSPRIAGQKVIWNDYSRESNGFPSKKTLHYYDLIDDQTKKVEIGSSLQRIEGPYSVAISKDWVCYVGKASRYSKNIIYCRDSEMGDSLIEDIQISNGRSSFGYPDVSDEGYLVYMSDGRNKYGYFINLNDLDFLSDPKRIDYSNPESQQFYPKVWKNIAVWSEKSAATRTFNILGKNLETGDFLFMWEVPEITSPDVWQNWVVWKEDSKIILFDYENFDKITLSQNAWQHPKIRDGKVFWEELQNGKNLINIYDIKSENTEVLDFDLRWSADPDLLDNVLVFQAPPEDSSEEAQSMDIWLVWL